jgi:hypothetical protein
MHAIGDTQQQQQEQQPLSHQTETKQVHWRESMAAMRLEKSRENSGSRRRSDDVPYRPGRRERCDCAQRVTFSCR